MANKTAKAECEWGLCTDPSIGYRDSIPSCRKHLSPETRLERMARLERSCRLTDEEKVDLRMLMTLARRVKNTVDLHPELLGISWKGLRKLWIELGVEADFEMRLAASRPFEAKT